MRISQIGLQELVRRELTESKLTTSDQSDSPTLVVRYFYHTLSRATRDFSTISLRRRMRAVSSITHALDGGRFNHPEIPAWELSKHTYERQKRRRYQIVREVDRIST